VKKAHLQGVVLFENVKTKGSGSFSRISRETVVNNFVVGLSN